MSTGRISVGQQLEPFVIERVDLEAMKTVAAILQDPNPIHYDTELTKSLGVGELPVNQGPINLTWLLQCAIVFAGGPEKLVSLNTRFLGNVLGTERFVATGVVRAVDTAAGTATLELSATSNDRPVLGAEAVVRI
jgi:acyl dehydratase